jgi:hypothetical protein
MSTELTFGFALTRGAGELGPERRKEARSAVD